MSNLIEVKEYTELGYSPVVVFEEWRVAVLNYHPELLPDSIESFQKHDKTDEVFVLLKGNCILFALEEDGLVKAFDMQPGKMYNVKKGVYHSHTLSEDAMVLIVENENTGDGNSPKMQLSEAQRAMVTGLARQLWG